MKRISMVFMGVFLFHATSGISQEIIAHRGASHLAPENTVASVNLGFELGADAVEIDVKLSKDKKIVVIHDGTTTRTSGVEYKVTETNSEDLRKLDVGSWKDAKYQGEKIPFLEEVLAVVPKGRTLVIEAKTDEEIIPYLEAAVEKSGIQERLALISFNKEAAIQGKKAFPEMPVFWLLGNFNNYSMEEAIEIAKEHELEGLDVHHKLVTPEFRKAMTEAGLKIYVYTVNDPETGKALAAAGVDGITTDKPELMAKSLE